MRGVLAVSAVILCGCVASGPSLVARPATQTIEVSNAAGRIRVDPSTSPSVTTVAFPLEQLWRALPAAFDSLAIPVTRLDTSAHIIGNGGFKLRQHLGRVALSRYLDCGQTQIGPNADSYDVVLIVLTQVKAAGSETTSIATTLDASARPIAFSQAYSRCASRGLLESRLVDVVRARLTK